MPVTRLLALTLAVCGVVQVAACLSDSNSGGVTTTSDSGGAQDIAVADDMEAVDVAAPADVAALDVPPQDVPPQDVPPTDVSPQDTPGPSDTSVALDRIVLDPATLSFFGLPINSIRAAVSGYDPVARACATLLFDFSNTGRRLGAHCEGFDQTFPYVIVQTGVDENTCGWEYGSDVEVLATEGCIDFAEMSAVGVDLADLKVSVESEAFTGTIVVDNRTPSKPGLPTPVSFGFRLPYANEAPPWVYIQTGDALGLPTWVQVRRADGGVPGARISLFDRCDIPVCGEVGGGPCGAALPQSYRVDSALVWRMSVWLTWDGYAREVSADAPCLVRVPAPSGPYVATFCFSSDVDADTGESWGLDCFQEAFELPTDRQVLGVAFERP